jgi:hypothetical protein
MTSASSILSALRSLISYVRVITADGISLPISSRGTLSTPFFSVPTLTDVSLFENQKNFFYNENQ